MTEDTHVDDQQETEERNHADADAEDEQNASDSAPLSDLAGRVRDRKTQPNRSRTDVDKLFESIEVDELGDDVWTALVDGDEDEPDVGVGVGVGAEATPVDENGQRAEHVVPKRSFCQRCEYFEAPPTFGCTHDGTEILEIVDSSQFRVRNCPMVDRDD